MYIELLGRGDRLGANITCFIAQIIYAVHNNLYIRYDRNFINSGDNVRFVPYNQTYNNSIFIKTMFDFIDIHNIKLVIGSEGENANMFSIHFFELISKVLLNIKKDHFSYFKEKIYPEIKDIFLNNAKQNGYIDNIPFNPNKTILVHLRLDDVKYRNDYDGRVCCNHFNNYINNDIMTNNDVHQEIIDVYPLCNFQSPLSKSKIQNQINIALEKNPDYEVIIVTSNNENVAEFPYRYISNDDESFDLFLLCNADVVILSRSTFALSCMYFGIAKDIYVPMWGHISCFGLTTKYDNMNINYFY
jgi:hypothetical protein